MRADWGSGEDGPEVESSPGWQGAVRRGRACLLPLPPPGTTTDELVKGPSVPNVRNVFDCENSWLGRTLNREESSSTPGGGRKGLSQGCSVPPNCLPVLHTPGFPKPSSGFSYERIQEAHIWVKNLPQDPSAQLGSRTVEPEIGSGAGVPAHSRVWPGRGPVKPSATSVSKGTSYYGTSPAHICPHLQREGAPQC